MNVSPFGFDFQGQVGWNSFDFYFDFDLSQISVLQWRQSQPVGISGQVRRSRSPETVASLFRRDRV